MVINNSKLVTYFALVLLSLFWINSSFAANPPDITGTWSAVGNQTTGNLIITQEASTAKCKPIHGTIFGSNYAIEGYYCPSLGQVSFIRHSTFVGGSPIQFYRGVVATTGTTKRMAGTFFIWNSDGGTVGPTDPVEFPFSATK